MTFQITSLYAAVLALAAIILSVAVSIRRGKHGVSILDGGFADLALSIRRHGNFIETAPFLLLLMALAEVRGMPALWLHVIGVLFLASRLLHAIGIKVDKPADPLRATGMLGTLVSLLALAVYLILSHF